jgi:hypothetical protein
MIIETLEGGKISVAHMMLDCGNSSIDRVSKGNNELGVWKEFVDSMRGVLRKVLTSYRWPEVIRGFLTYEGVPGRLIEKRGVPLCSTPEILGTIEKVYFSRGKIEVGMLAKHRAKPGRTCFLSTNNEEVGKCHANTRRSENSC